MVADRVKTGRNVALSACGTLQMLMPMLSVSALGGQSGHPRRKWAAIPPPTKCNLVLVRVNSDAEVIPQDRLGQAIKDGYFGTPTNRAPINLPSPPMSGA